MATGRRIQLPLARFDLNQSTGQHLFWHFKLNSTDKHSEAIAREENTQLPAAVHVSETCVLKLSIGSYVVLAPFGKLSTLTSLALSLSSFSQSLTCK